MTDRAKLIRRGWILAAVVALIGTFALWFAATVKKSPLTRSFSARKVPAVVAGRDRRGPEERQVVQDDDAATLRCQFDGEGSPGTLLAMGEGQALTSGGDLSLRVPTGNWTVYWQSDRGSLELGRVEPEPGAVETCRVTAEGWVVTGKVTNPDGTPVGGATVLVCGARVVAGEDGAYVGFGRSAPCDVRAVYQDGILTRRGEPVTVNAFLARGVDLVVDDTPVAGMGIGFRMARGGARVNLVHPATPAEEAGVEVGDIVVSIDGQPTPGLSDDAFIALGTGREGSLVTLEVERGGERYTFSFRRERLDAVDTG